MALPAVGSVLPIGQCASCATPYDQGAHRKLELLEAGASKCHQCVLTELEAIRITSELFGQIPVRNIEAAIEKVDYRKHSRPELKFVNRLEEGTGRVLLSQRTWNFERDALETIPVVESELPLPMYHPSLKDLIEREVRLGNEALLRGATEEARSHYLQASLSAGTTKDLQGISSSADAMLALISRDRFMGAILQENLPMAQLHVQTMKSHYQAGTVKGNAWAMLSLATFFFNEGNQKDFQTYLSQSFNEGCPNAWLKVGLYYLNRARKIQLNEPHTGLKVAYFKQLFYYISKSVANLEDLQGADYKWAHHNVGRCSAEGIGCSRHAKAALEAYKKVYAECDTDITSFRVFLNELYKQLFLQLPEDLQYPQETMLNERQFFDAMQFFLEKTATYVQEHPIPFNLVSFADIQQKTAICFSQGRGVARDPQMALHFFYEAKSTLEKVSVNALLLEQQTQIQAVYQQIIEDIRFHRILLNLEKDESIPDLPPAGNLA